MAKNHKGPTPKQKDDSDGKPQGFIDKLLHGDHGHATEAEEMAVSEPKEDDLPVDPVPQIKTSPKSVDAGASKHQHKKFDKFQKGK